MWRADRKWKYFVKDEPVSENHAQNSSSSQSQLNNIEDWSDEKKTRYYSRILGVQEGCEAEVLRRAYRKKALFTHPDKADGNYTEFVLLNDAYEHMKNRKSGGICFEMLAEGKRDVTANECDRWNLLFIDRRGKISRRNKTSISTANGPPTRSFSFGLRPQSGSRQQPSAASQLPLETAHTIRPLHRYDPLLEHTKRRRSALYQSVAVSRSSF